MHHPAKLTLALLSFVAMTATARATELYTFDFAGAPIASSLNGLSSGSYTSVGTADAITLDITTNLGVLDFTSVSGSLGIDASASSNNTPQNITLNFSSLLDSPLRFHSITMTSIMEIGSPVFRTLEVLLDPSISSQSLYRYDNSQSILMGSYEAPEIGEVNLVVNNLQYGFHSIQSVTIASDFSAASVPEPTTVLLLILGLCPLGTIRSRRTTGPSRFAG